MTSARVYKSSPAEVEHLVPILMLALQEGRYFLDWVPDDDIDVEGHQCIYNSYVSVPTKELHPSVDPYSIA